LLVVKHGLLVFVGVSVEENITIVAVAAPTIFVIGVVVVLLVIGMAAMGSEAATLISMLCHLKNISSGE